MSYGMDKDFERITAALSVTDNKFWNRVGRYVDSSMIEDPGAQAVYKLCRDISNDHGAPSLEVVKQRAAFLMDDGKLDNDTLQDVHGLLELSKDSWDGEAILGELVGPVRQAMFRSISKRITTAGVSNREPKFDGFIDDMLLCDKLGVSIADQDVPASEFGLDSDQLIDDAPTYIQMPTGIAELDLLLRGGPCLGSLITILGDSKAGKCEKKGSPILMYNGTIKKVEDIRIGDKIMGPDSKPRNVLSTNCGEGEMYEIRPTRGKPWQVNIEHVLTIESIKKNGGDAWVRTIVDVSVKDWLAWPEYRRRNSNLFTPDALEFDRVEPKLPIDPYFLGVYLGDGSTRGSGQAVGITTADPEIEAVVMAQAKVHNLRVSKYPTKGKASQYYMRRNNQQEEHSLICALEDLGLYKLGSGEKFIPDDYKLGSLETRRQILAGLLDTDGYLTKKVSYDYISKSERLAEDVAFVAKSLGLSAHVNACRKRCQTGAVGTYYRVNIGEANGTIPVRIPRKVSGKKIRTGYDSRKTKFTVVRTGEVHPYYGFTLDSDARYCRGDFTVTHNSMSLNHIAAVAALNNENVGYLSLELNEADVHRRLMAAISGVAINDLMDVNTRRQASQIIKTLYKKNALGKIFIGAFQPKTINEREVCAWFDKQEKDKGVRIRTRIVDYGDLIVSSKREDRESEYKTGFTVWAALKAMANGDGNPNWVHTASQAKRPEWKPGQPIPVLGRGSTGDSRHKYQLSDLFLTMTPQPDISARNGYIWMVDADRHFGATGQATDVVPHMRHMGRMADISGLGL